MKFVVVVLTIWSLAIAENFKPETFDYCNIKCEKREEKGEEEYAGEEYEEAFLRTPQHSACDCRTKPPREEVLDDMAKFRQEVLDEHNYWRNWVANGNATAKHSDVVAASDMLGLNYDLELEYIARCLAVNSFKEKHDKCRRTHDDKYVGQNLASIRNKNLSAIKGMVQTWYDQGAGAVETKDIDYLIIFRYFRYFSQLVWAKATHVGCTRQWNLDTPHSKWRLVLICNYGSTLGSAGNVRYTPIYQRGPACEKCPSGTKCESERYPTLCGKIFPAPTDEPVALDTKGQGAAAGSEAREGTWKNQLIILLATFSVLFLFY